MRFRSFVTSVAIPVIRTWMHKSLDAPGRYAVAGTTAISEFSVMRVKMALGAGKIGVKQFMIDFRYVRSMSIVLGVALQAVLFRFMKPYLRL